MSSLAPEPASQAPKIARAPFNGQGTDTALLSSDYVEFRVWRSILREASHFFDTMFDVPQPPHDGASETADRLARIPVAEYSRTLDLLLRFCYPVENPEMSSLDDVRRVLEAVRKYDMGVILRIVGRTLVPFIETEPLRVWAIACHFNIFTEARTAAGAHRLLQFCASADDATAFEIIPELKNHHPDECSRPASTSFEFAPDWMPEVDIILRSSDSVDFHAHHLILAIAPPVLRQELSEKPCDRAYS